MISIPAYAKVNLALEVVARRADGFHDLSTVFVIIDWHDLVSLELSVGIDHGVDRRPGSIEVTGPTAAAAMGEPDALVARAAVAVAGLASAALRRPARLDVRVVKRIPVLAGLGGGSADAAAVLRGGAAEVARRFPGTRLPREALADAGAALGSDVPALLAGGTSLAAGRGEELLAVPGAPRLHLAVAIAGASSTAAAYAALTGAERRADGRSARVAAALREGRHPHGADLGSALEGAASRANPSLAAELTRLRSGTGLPWSLTGSGGAAFHLASGGAGAAAAVAAAVALGMEARSCRTLPLGFSPP